MPNGNKLYIIICIIVFLLPNFSLYLYGTDTPQHIEQISEIKSLILNGAPKEIFKFNALTPYLLPYIIWAILCIPLDGIIRPDQIILSTNFIFFIIALQYYYRSTNSNFYFIPLAALSFFGLSYQWGFHPFIFSVSLGIILLAIIEDNKIHQRWRIALTTAILLIFSHGLTAAFFSCMIAFKSFIENDRIDKIKGYALAGFIFFIIAIWKIASGSAFPGHQPGINFNIFLIESPYTFYQKINEINNNYPWNNGRISGFFSRALGIYDGYNATIIGLIILAAPWILGLKTKKSTEIASYFLPLVIALAIMPTSILGAIFAHERFAILFLPIYFTIFKASANKNAAIFSIILTALLGIQQYSSSLKISREISDLYKLIEYLPPNNFSLYLDYSTPKKNQQAPYFLHAGHHYSYIKSGHVIPSFASLNLQPMIYSGKYNPEIRISNGHEWFPETRKWSSYKSKNYTLIIIKGSKSKLEKHIGKKITGTTWTSGSWFACYNQELPKINDKNE